MQVVGKVTPVESKVVGVQTTDNVFLGVAVTEKVPVPVGPHDEPATSAKVTFWLAVVAVANTVVRLAVLVSQALMAPGTAPAASALNAATLAFDLALFKLTNTIL
ncbi:TPA: hypothetical protein DCL22_02910, partial [Candidatus Moranbacteria bacterium]|nr:hypothetical protein [Candidatus Moranbacteria bacterium]